MPMPHAFPLTSERTNLSAWKLEGGRHVFAMSPSFSGLLAPPSMSCPTDFFSNLDRRGWPSDILLSFLSLSGQKSPFSRALFRFSAVYNDALPALLRRLRNVGVRSGEFCVCKLVASTWAGQIGAIHI